MSQIYDEDARPLPNRLVNTVEGVEFVFLFCRILTLILSSTIGIVKKMRLDFRSGIFRFMYSSTGYRFLYIRKAFFVLKY